MGDDISPTVTRTAAMGGMSHTDVMLYRQCPCVILKGTDLGRESIEWRVQSIADCVLYSYVQYACP